MAVSMRIKFKTGRIIAILYLYVYDIRLVPY